MSRLWTVGALLQWTQQFFAGKGIESPRLDAEILLSHALKKERIFLYAHYDEPVNPEELSIYRAMVKKRANRISVAHILGTKAFMGLDFRVSSHVLIPRPETEMLVETVMKYEDAAASVSLLDIGTGSGAIILSLLHYFPNAEGVGVDISPEALSVAAENGEKLGLNERVRWIQSDLLAAVQPRLFDWIVSNPPYLTKEDMCHLQPEVMHDPKLALYGGPDGLDVYRNIAEQSPAYIKIGGHCAVEIGAGQAECVTRIFAQTGAYTHAQTVKDYGGIDRVLVFTRKE